MSFLDTLGKVASVSANTAFLPEAAALNALGVDTTPGYSATNVLKTQLKNLTSGSAQSAPQKSSGAGTSSSGAQTASTTSDGGSSAASQAAAAAAAKQAQAQALFNNQLGGIYSSLGSTASSQAGDLTNQLNDYVDSLSANQVGRNNQTIQNYLAKQQGAAGVDQFVGQGIRSSGVQLNNENAGDSSAAGAIANAYGQIGRGQLSDVGNQFAQAQNQVQQGQTADQVALANKLRDLPAQQNDIINGIVNSAQQQLQYLNTSMVNSGLSPVDAQTVQQNITGDAMGKLQGLDQLLSQGGQAALTPQDQSQAVQQAGQLYTAGQAPASAYTFNTDVPTQLQNGPVASNLPVFVAPTSKDKTAIAAPAVAGS